MPKSDCEEVPVKRPLLTGAQLGKLMRASPVDKREEYARILSDVMRAGGITTLKRISMFLAQLAQESGQLRYQRELWDPKKIPEQARYEGRKDLGNTEPGDGYTFRGWGWKQITGRANTLAASLALFGDDRLVQQPELLNDPEIGARAAVHYWVSHGCNELADAGKFRSITRVINGKATDGHPSYHSLRQAHLDRILQVLTSREFLQ